MLSSASPGKQHNVEQLAAKTVLASLLSAEPGLYRIAQVQLCKGCCGRCCVCTPTQSLVAQIASIFPDEFSVEDVAAVGNVAESAVAEAMDTLVSVWHIATRDYRGGAVYRCVRFVQATVYVYFTPVNPVPMQTARAVQPVP